MAFFGAHVSISESIAFAPSRAQALGANAFACFTKNQRQWQGKALSPEQCSQFKAACQSANIEPKHILPHASYLINLASPDEGVYRRSVDALLDEVQRCRQLGLMQINVHPGSHLHKLTESEALIRIAQGINTVLAASEGVQVVLENTAGQGGCLGHRFEQLAGIIEHVHDQSRVKVCIDTCHAFSAGYDLSTIERSAVVFDQLDALIGLEFLAGFHLNGSRTPMGSRVDRHASLNEGYLGLEVFKYLACNSKLAALPMILETPNSDRWAEEIAFLRAQAHSA